MLTSVLEEVKTASEVRATGTRVFDCGAQSLLSVRKNHSAVTIEDGPKLLVIVDSQLLDQIDEPGV